MDQPQPQLIDRPTPVDVDELDAANAWGIRHMSGNVDEVAMSCRTDAHPGLATASAYLAQAGAQVSCRRVAKGGAFDTGKDFLRLARRYRPEEDRRRSFVGFRAVRELWPAPSACRL